MSGPIPSVLVLGGGPDDERPVSLQSAAAVGEALRRAGAEVHEVTIDRPTADELRRMPGDVVFPVLHGGFGEGGPLQDLLEATGRPYVGCRPGPARLAMDKLATKLLSARLGVDTAPAAVVNLSDDRPPIGLPLVLKPVHDGSSVGLHLCRDEAAWREALESARRDVARRPGRAYMAERLVRGRELTVGLVAGEAGLAALPLIEIVPAGGVYDYAAKYERDDTRYIAGPELAPGVAEGCARSALRLAEAIGVRHLCRVDFLLEHGGGPLLLELNTMPGFTSHSLLPLAARAAGIEMGELCVRLVRAAAPRAVGV